MTPAPEPPFTLTQLRYFVAAAEAASMTDAARRLLVSQSAVSTATALLERQLGVQLLVRHHARGLSLTRAGELFLRDARAFLAHAADLGDTAKSLGGSLAGRVTVGCFGPLAPFYLPGLLHAFAVAQPRVGIETIEGETESLRRALIEGRCELALLYDMDLGDDVEIDFLAGAPPYLLVSAEHRLAGARGAHLGDVAGEPMVLLDLPHSREYFQSLAERGGFAPRIGFRSTSYETVRALVARGFGYTILNQRPLTDRTYDGGTVAAVNLLDDLAPLPIVLGTARGVRPTTRAAAFAEVCRQVVPAIASLPTPGAPSRESRAAGQRP